MQKLNVRRTICIGAAFLSISAFWQLYDNIIPKILEGTFGIGETISRSALAQALWTMAGKPETTAECTFIDVPADDPARTAIIWAADTGLMTGSSDTLFAPQDAVTREQMVTTLWCFEQAQEIPAQAVSRDLTDFRDAGRIRDDAREAFRWACGAGIVSGDSRGMLRPGEELTREQLAVMLYRYSQLPKVQTAGSQEPAEDSVTAAGA